MAEPSTAAGVTAFFAPSLWAPPRFEHGHPAIVDTVMALQPRFVVDVGCGSHPFKGHVPNLIGIDLTNPAADLVCDLLDAPIRPASGLRRVGPIREDAHSTASGTPASCLRWHYASRSTS